MAEWEIRDINDVMDAIDQEKQLDPGLISDDEKRRFVQDCLDDLGDLGVFERVIETQVTSGPVDLSVIDGQETGFDKIIEVYWNGRALDPVAPRSVDRNQEAGLPTGYWLVGSQLYFYPRLAPGVSGTLTVEMIYRPLTVTDLPREWRRLLVIYGTHRCHKKNGSTFSAREYLTEYETRKTSLYNKALQKRNQRKTTNRGMNDRPPYMPFSTIDDVLL